jgi:formate dehydrogenase major subunit
MKLIKKRDLTATESASVSSGVLGSTVDRRAFLRRAGLGLGGTAVAATLPTTMIRRASAERIDPGVESEIRKSVCTHCSVGCGVVAEVQNGVWTGQEPADFDSPFNMGGHCAKGASVREHGHGERRLKYPMKLTGGNWTRLSWEQAIDEIGDKVLDIREQYGPDSVYWLGSAKFNNEQAYLFRKYAALWGTNNVDHQARICHSTTVAGVANTWGYGAMTNSYNDMHNCKAMFFIGSNAAEAHPVAMQHILRGKENGAKMIVVDPRFTRTAAHADQFLRIRPGTDVPIIWGILWHVFENGWEDEEYIQQRVYGMDEIRAEVAKWTPDVVENVTGVPEEQVALAARTMAENRPGTIVWCMGGTQHTIGNNNTRAYCAMQLALGNVGVSGGGANIFRGHDNVQGATDLGILSHTLPGYYGLSDGSWKHWSRVWGLDYDWVRGRFDTEYANTGNAEDGPVPFANPMNSAGMPVSRWVDGVLEEAELIDQRNQLKAMRSGDEESAREARPRRRRRSVSDAHGGPARPGGRRLPAARRDAVRDLRLGHRIEPLAAVARQAHRAALRGASRPHDHVQAVEETRILRRAVQEHQGRERRAADRRHPARDQSRHVDDRLHGPESGAAQAPHGEQAHLQRDDTESRGRAVRRRLLRAAVAVVGNPGHETPGHTDTLRHQQTCR